MGHNALVRDASLTGREHGRVAQAFQVVSPSEQQEGIRSTAWRKARDHAGLGPEAIPYTLRHTMATEMRKRGVPEWEVRGWLGHKGVGVTEDYAQFPPDYLRAGTRAIDAYFKLLRSRARQLGGVCCF